ncbi:MAG: hypothetical protein RIG66_30830 [Coleofasciculus sp. E2-BRE-01]
MRLTHPTNTDYEGTGVTAIARLEQPEFSIISMQSEQLNPPSSRKRCQNSSKVRRLLVNASLR